MPANGNDPVTLGDQRPSSISAGSSGRQTVGVQTTLLNGVPVDISKEMALDSNSADDDLRSFCVTEPKMAGQRMRSPEFYTLEFAGQIPAFNQWALLTHWHITCELAEVGDECVSVMPMKL